MDMHVDDRFRGHRPLRRGRVSLPGQVYHVTASTLGRRPWFADFHVGCEAVRAFHQQVALADARLLAWVLMPDHGHWLLQMGECMPLQLYRFDWMQGNADGRAHLRGGKQVKLQHPVSHYFRNNIWITTSGVAWEPAIRFCMEVLGPERVLYAMDYPYQFVPSEVTVSDELPMTPADKKKYFQSNAEKLFKIGQ